MKRMKSLCQNRIAILAACYFTLTLGAFSTAQDIEQLEENAVTRVVEAASSTVIRFDTIGGNNRVDGAIVGNGPASGTIVSDDGFVVSASFHFAHQPATILARLPDGSRTSAEIVGRDLTRKIVLLKLAVEEESKSVRLPTLPTISKQKVQVGETVIALGRAFDGDANVSTGIVSAMNRVWDKAIQTDAKISPANFGGPLLNLKGELIGILVPMSPDDEGEMAGTQWYDSGIGFAVPISDIELKLDELKSGKTLQAGLAGISLAGTDTYADAAVVAYCHGTSPAGKAGIKPLDNIVEINGRTITRQSEMKHALGPLYEGDAVNFIVERPGNDNTTKRLEIDFKLVGEIEPFVPSAIGLLAAMKGGRITVEHVFENSPAEKGGVKVGSVLTEINDVKVSTLEKTRLAISSFEVGNLLTVQLIAPLTKKVVSIPLVAGNQMATIPEHESIVPNQFKETAPGASQLVKVSSAEFANDCYSIIPKIKPDLPTPGLLVWISEPGKLDRKQIEKTWRKQCEQFNVVLLVPESTDENKWDPRDFPFIASAIDTLAQQVRFDRSRTVIGGWKLGGTAASAIAFNQRDLFRGLVLIDSGLSRHAGTPTTSPVEPMMILAGSNGKTGEKQTASLDALKKAHFPTQIEQKAVGSSIDDWVKDILAWVNATNRL